VYRASHEGGRIDDYADVPGEAARLTRLAGYRSAVMAPITADGRLWGALSVFSSSTGHFPADAQQRLADFTNLVALALESAEAHDQLTASRARIVEASVAERRRLERNLHDGAQQHLLALSYDLRLARASAEADADGELVELMESAVDDAQAALEELRELAQGIYPAILMEAGLEAALETLADEASLPVELKSTLHERQPPSVEAAAYFAVAEAVEDAAARAATSVHVDVTRAGERLAVAVDDDGRGRSTSLGHVADRIGALGGSVELGPTTLRASIPCA
jgi:signal transduction histidine kinase